MAGIVDAGPLWLFASNAANFDAEKAFATDDEIFWSETSNAHVLLGDTVFLYATKPIQALTHQCVVSETGIPSDQVGDADEHWAKDDAFQERQSRTWMALRLVRTLNVDARRQLSLTAMQAAGMEGGVQGRRRAPQKIQDLLRDVLLSDQSMDEGDHAAESYLSDDLLVDEFKARIESGHYAVSDLETFIPDRYSYQKTRGSAQSAFAKVVKGNYGHRCALTVISTPYFLVASHIVPWSQDSSIRIDPRNGICLSTLVDRAFEDGYLRIDRESVVHVNQERLADDPVLAAELSQYDGSSLQKPAAGEPHPDFLARRWASTAG